MSKSKDKKREKKVVRVKAREWCLHTREDFLRLSSEHPGMGGFISTSKRKDVKTKKPPKRLRCPYCKQRFSPEITLVDDDGIIFNLPAHKKYV